MFLEFPLHWNFIYPILILAGSCFRLPNAISSSCNKEIKTWMGKENTVFGRLERIWKSTGCSVVTKVRLYKSIVLRTLLYRRGAETWPTTVAMGGDWRWHTTGGWGGFCMSFGVTGCQTQWSERRLVRSWLASSEGGVLCGWIMWLEWMTIEELNRS